MTKNSIFLALAIAFSQAAMAISIDQNESTYTDQQDVFQDATIKPSKAAQLGLASLDKLRGNATTLALASSGECCAPCYYIGFGTFACRSTDSSGQCTSAKACTP